MGGKQDFVADRALQLLAERRSPPFCDSQFGAKGGLGFTVEHSGVETHSASTVSWWTPKCDVCCANRARPGKGKSQRYLKMG